MKLYFYFLEASKIRTAECEVEEKQKTYKPVDKFPSGYYYSYVKKEEIGKLAGHNRDVVVLLESDKEQAARIFSEKCKNGISRAKSDIQYAESRIEECNFMIKMIDDWKTNPTI